MNPKKIGDKTKGLSVVNRWTCTLVLVWLTGGPLWAAGTTSKQLNVQPAFQEHTEWCWAACAEMVIEYLEPGTDVKQCDLAKVEYATTVNCCNESASNFTSGCNSAGNVPTLCFEAHHLRHRTIADDRRLTWKSIKKQIDQDKPVLLSWFWNNSFSSGHMVVIYGYGEENGEKVLYLNDPNRHPQVGTQTYIKFEQDYKDLEHDQTWYDIRKDSNP